MSQEIVDKVADTVLDDGYLLYPYRPPVKHRHRLRQKAVERTIAPMPWRLNTLVQKSGRAEFQFPHNVERESISDANGQIAAFIEREQHALAGVVEVAVNHHSRDLYTFRVLIENQSPFALDQNADPEISAVSHAELFDATEINEILNMSDDEKKVAASVDERVKALLDRTGNLSPKQFNEFHGTIQ